MSGVPSSARCLPRRVSRGDVATAAVRAAASRAAATHSPTVSESDRMRQARRRRERLRRGRPTRSQRHGLDDDAFLSLSSGTSGDRTPSDECSSVDTDSDSDDSRGRDSERMRRRTRTRSDSREREVTRSPPPPARRAGVLASARLYTGLSPAASAVELLMSVGPTTTVSHGVRFTSLRGGGGAPASGSGVPVVAADTVRVFDLRRAGGPVVGIPRATIGSRTDFVPRYFFGRDASTAAIASALDIDSSSDEESTAMPGFVHDSVIAPQQRHPDTPYGTWRQCDDALWRLQTRNDQGDAMTDLQVSAIQMQFLQEAEERERMARERTQAEATDAAAAKDVEEKAARETPAARRAVAAAAAVARAGASAGAATAPDTTEDADSGSGAAGPPPPPNDDSGTYIRACVICRDTPPKFLWRCGHPSACAKCYRKLVIRNGGQERVGCPICRNMSKPIEMFL